MVWDEDGLGGPGWEPVGVLVRMQKHDEEAHCIPQNTTRYPHQNIVGQITSYDHFGERGYEPQKSKLLSSPLSGGSSG